MIASQGRRCLDRIPDHRPGRNWNRGIASLPRPEKSILFWIDLISSENAGYPVPDPVYIKNLLFSHSSPTSLPLLA